LHAGERIGGFTGRTPSHRPRLSPRFTAGLCLSLSADMRALRVDNPVVDCYVAVTDPDWYRFLARRRDLEEVNFWRPRDTRRFGAIAVGEPFFFKTHAPHNRVVGGGFYSSSVNLPLSEAWEYFGAANGVASLAEMRARISRYRPLGLGEDPVIGCLFIRDPVFFADDAAVAPPPDYPRSGAMQGKSYHLALEPAAGYFRDLMQRLLGGAVDIDLTRPWHHGGPVFGDPRLSPYRLGQQAFQAVVLDAYHRRCAITGSKIRPVLQAAHIRPVTEGGEHRLDNGLLLRSDVHTLFDRGYLGIDSGYRLLVSPRLREEFGNGDRYYARAGQVITLPAQRSERPCREFIEWHRGEKFLVS
jgi:putative restriction endonuclease